MKLFGFELRSPFVHAVGELPASSTDLAVEREQSAGKSVATEPQGKAIPSASEIKNRAVASDPLGDWYLALPDKLEPKQVSQIIRAALAGNIWQAVQLTRRMSDSWPEFVKCCHELQSAISRVKYTVIPFQEQEGEEPSDSAKEKADTVTRAMANFEPDRFEDEDGFSGMVYDCADSIINGVAMCQLMWDKKPDPKGVMEWLPRASAYIHPRHYTFTSSGRMGVGNTNVSDPMWMQLQADKPLLDDERRIIVAKFKGKSGGCIGAARMRCLTWWWVAVVYGRDFALAFAQKYGGPFLDVPYQSGIPQGEIDKLELLAKRAANLGYCVHPDTAELKVTPAQAMGAENPQVVLMRMANEACQILLLGQTATTQGTPGKLGEEGTRGKVRQEYLENFAAWMAESVLTYQFAWSVLKVNYNDTSELPTIKADFTEAEDPQAAATRWQGIAMIPGLPVLYEEICEGLGIRMAEEGDKVMQNGRLGALGDTELSLDEPTPQEQAQMEQQQAQFEAMQQGGDYGGGDYGGDYGGGSSDEESLYARHATKVRQALTRATDDELAELRGAVVKAQAAGKTGHVNGEWDDVKIKIKHLSTKQPRFKV